MRRRDERTTELGREVRCAKCRAYWPADGDFFYMRGGVPHSWCKACYQADREAKGTDRTSVRRKHARCAA